MEIRSGRRIGRWSYLAPPKGWRRWHSKTDSALDKAESHSGNPHRQESLPACGSHIGPSRKRYHQTRRLLADFDQSAISWGGYRFVRLEPWPVRGQRLLATSFAIRDAVCLLPCVQSRKKIFPLPRVFSPRTL